MKQKYRNMSLEEKLNYYDIITDFLVDEIDFLQQSQSTETDIIQRYDTLIKIIYVKSLIEQNLDTIKGLEREVIKR